MVTSTTTTIGFVSRDPIGYGRLDRNLYQYVRSRSLIGMDPRGNDLVIFPGLEHNTGGSGTVIGGGTFPPIPIPPYDPLDGFNFPGPDDFKWYGNWGGPGWACREWQKECNDLLDVGDPDYVPPKDLRDACYEDHDRCINACAKKFTCPNDISHCIETCDHNLGNCLCKNSTDWWMTFECIAFHTIIPIIVH